MVAKSITRDVAVVESLEQLVSDYHLLLIVVTNWGEKPSAVVQKLLEEAKDAC